MSDEVEGKEEASEEQSTKKPINVKSLLMLGGCAVLQLAIVLAAWYFVRMANEAPQQVTAAEPADEPDVIEVSVIPKSPDEKIRAINAKEGKLVYWGLKVFLQVRKDDVDHVKDKLIANENLVKQEIARLVADCEPFLLKEAGQPTLKRQIRFALNGILGKGTINQVLISECIPQTLD